VFTIPASKSAAVVKLGRKYLGISVVVQGTIIPLLRIAASSAQVSFSKKKSVLELLYKQLLIFG
jgi:hypothetical protein